MSEDRRAKQIAAVRDVLSYVPIALEIDYDDLARTLVDAVEAMPRIPANQVGAYEARGFGRRNPHCSNCGDERGGPFGHEISECSYRDGMSVGEMVQLPHLADRRPEVWDHYIDRYFEQEPIRREAEARGWAAAVEALRDEARRRELAEALLDYDTRTARLVDYWWQTTGWVKTDWDAIVRFAADWLAVEITPPDAGAPDGATPTDDRGE